MVRIVCEGLDDELFIKQLLRHLKIKEKDYDFNQHIQSTKGKSYLLKKGTYEENKLNDEVGKTVNEVLFIFDADFIEDDKQSNGLEKSKERIEQLIKDLNWDIDTDYYIFDKNLDDFIVKTLSKEQQNCFKEFDECLNIQGKNKNKKISTCIYKKLYPQAPYDFLHENFKPLTEKLTNLFQ
ncbi:MAG: hypothetical protein H0A76_07770 [Candidatus Thiodubiliella endoseptemdiera]|uniref:DUF4276 family protein n=1 Tax=Candidatus Thiodubiliella endoseptemdiera TaxID=2738886 RepID=A0A853F462_9GAMM|nr:hypothetical protein [Candidatus Thiodubiliella endoseptemdiera]